MMDAVRAATERAKKRGACIGIMRDATHAGAIGRYAHWVVEQGCACIILAAAYPFMPYHGAKVASLPTAPIVMGVPTGAARRGGARHGLQHRRHGQDPPARTKGEPLEEGWALDADGRATTDPNKAAFPLPLGGAKGSGLSLMTELLAGVLGGNSILTRVLGPERSKRNAQNCLIIVMDPAAFRPDGGFMPDVDKLADLIKELPLREGFDEILLPGERGEPHEPGAAPQRAFRCRPARGMRCARSPRPIGSSCRRTRLRGDAMTGPRRVAGARRHRARAGPASSAYAQSDYPSRPVRIIVGFGAGAVADTPARLLAGKFSQSLGQQFVVENRPGAGSNIAAEAVSRAPPDGHTLFMATSANTINATTSANLNFDITKDFAAIALICSVPNMLVAHPSLGVDSLQELIALAKQKPEQIHYRLIRRRDDDASRGRTDQRDGGREARARALSGQRAGAHRRARRTHPAPVRAGLGGDPARREGRSLKAIAVTQLKRASIAPTVPTMAEAGLPGYDIGLWFGLLAPAGTPRDIIDKLARIANEALKAADVIVDAARRRPRAARIEPGRIRPLHRQRGGEGREGRGRGGVEEVGWVSCEVSGRSSW